MKGKSSHDASLATISPSKRTGSFHVPAGGQWQTLTPRSVKRLLENGGGGELENPGGFFQQQEDYDERDPRQVVLMNMTYANLALALVLVIMGAVGPKYPGHSGTTDGAYTYRGHRELARQKNPLFEEHCPTNEVDTANASILHSAVIVGLVIWFTQPCSAYTISNKVDRIGAAVTLLASGVCSATCLGALIIVMLDISYIAECCSLMEDKCEVSNLCTQFVTGCCTSEGVQGFCDDFSFQITSLSMTFVVFASTSAMTTMACTMTCRCWLDADPEKRAMMMVLGGATPAVSGARMGSRRFSSPSPAFLPASPAFSPRKVQDTLPLPSLGGKSPVTPTRRSSYSTPGNPMGSLSTPSRAAVPDSPKSDVGTGVRSGWLDDASVKKKRKSGSAAVGDVEALPIHIASFRGEGSKSVERTEIEPFAPRPSAASGRSPPKSLVPKGSSYIPDEGPEITSLDEH